MQRKNGTPELGTVVLARGGAFIGIGALGRSRRRQVVAMLCAVAGLLGTQSASADTTLADLIAGGTLPSLSGDLLFSEFELAGISGQVDADLANYTVVSLQDGFRVVPAEGSMDLFAGEAGFLKFDYLVSGIEGVEIEGTALTFEAAATGLGSSATVGVDLFSDFEMNDTLGMVAVFVTGAGGLQASDDLLLNDPIADLYGSTAISFQVAGAAESSASVFSLDQTFVTVPEPGATVLSLTVLLCLVTLGRLRTHTH